MTDAPQLRIVHLHICWDMWALRDQHLSPQSADTVPKHSTSLLQSPSKRVTSQTVCALSSFFCLAYFCYKMYEAKFAPCNTYELLSNFIQSP